MNLKAGITLITLASMAAFTAQGAVTGTASAVPHHHHPMRFHGDGFMNALNKLDLTEAQRHSIHDILDNARTQAKTQFAGHQDDYFTLMNPGDPNYDTALHNVETAATVRIEQRSQHATQIFNVLTPQQKAKLPQVIADMKVRMEKHHDEMHHAAPAA